MIILEGPDGAGKTTLAAKLESEHELRYHKYPDPPRTLTTLLSRVTEVHWIDNYLDLVLLDRHPIISEVVYGPVLRDRQRFGDYYLDFLGFLMRQEPLVIFVLPNYRTVRNGAKAGGHISGVEDNLQALYERYRWMMNMLRTSPCGRVVHYDRDAEYSESLMMMAVEAYVKEKKYGQRDRSREYAQESESSQARGYLREAEGADEKVSPHRSGERPAAGARESFDPHG